MAIREPNGKRVPISDVLSDEKIQESLRKLGIANVEKVLNCLYEKEGAESRRLNLRQDKVVQENNRPKPTLDEGILTFFRDKLGSEKLKEIIDTLGNLPADQAEITAPGTLQDFAPTVDPDQIPQPRLGNIQRSGTFTMEDILSEEDVRSILGQSGFELYYKAALGIRGAYMLAEPKGEGGFATVWKVLRFMERFDVEALKRSIITHIADRGEEFPLREKYLKAGAEFFNCSREELLTTKKTYFKKFLRTVLNAHERKGNLARIGYLTRPFATKEFAMKVATNDDAKTHFDKRFEREAELLATITELKGRVRALTGRPLFGGDHLINSYGFYSVRTEGGKMLPAYLMEMMPFSLKDIVMQDHIKDSVEIIYQATKAAHLLHKLGIVHRDIKPANIMINRRGYAVLTDLGILSLSSDEENGYMNSAKILTQFTKLTKKGEVIGSIGFMPPEQATGKEVDARSDLYSLGATLYSLLTHNRCHYMGVRNAESIQDAYFTFLRAIGELPDKDGKKRVLDITKPREYNPSIPEELEKVLIKALQVDKNKRFQNAEEFLSALENFR